MKDHKFQQEFDHIKDFRVYNVDQEWEHFLEKVDASAGGVSKSDIHSQDSLNANPSKVFRLPRYFAVIAAGLLVLIISTIAFLNVQKEAPTIVQEPSPNLIKQVEKKETPKEIATPLQEESVAIEMAPPVVIEQEVIFENELEDEYKTVAANEVITLADGSTLKILTSTVIKYPDSFEGASERFIDMKSGSVLFDVVENSKMPFKVMTENAGVSVLGTTFTLIAEGVINTLNIISGTVKFYSLADESISLLVNKGEGAIFDGNEMTSIEDKVEIALDEVIPEEEEFVEVVESEEELEKVPEKPALPTSKYDLKGLQGSWASFYGENIDLKLKNIDKSIRNKTFEFPNKYVSSGPAENLGKAIELLQNHFEVDYEKLDDCEHCYKINSIKAKQ